MFVNIYTQITLKIESILIPFHTFLDAIHSMLKFICIGWFRENTQGNFPPCT